MVLSAPLLTRLRVIKVKVEAAKGTKLAGDQALWVEDLEINPTAPFTERRGTGLYLGSSTTGVVGERSGVCKFKTPLRSAGSAAMEAGLAILLQGCGFKQTIEVYSMSSTHTEHKTISIDVFEDGVKKSLAGASGKVTIEGDEGGQAFCVFEFSGTWQAPVDAALPAYAPSTTAPMMLQAGTFTLGGETIKISKFSLDMGCEVVPRRDITAAGGIAYHMITDFDPVLSIDPEADLVAGYDYNGLWLAGTTAVVALALTDGTYTVTFSIPVMQQKELTLGDRDGIQIYDLTGQCLHTVAGNDAVAIAVT